MVAFKFNPIPKDRRLQMAWDELNFLKSLPLYELITNDTHFTDIPHWDRNIGMVQSISEWPCNRELDSDVSTFRYFLNEWVATQKTDWDMERYLNAPKRLAWPDLPTAPDYNVPFELGKTLMERRFGERVRGQDAGQLKMASDFFAGKGHLRAGYLRY